jgi:glutathione S-transferase
LTREEFMEMKTSGALRFGQVPMLEVVSADGSVVQLTQSSAIIKYVGKFAGLYPVNDDLLAALIDSILDQEVDCFMGLTCSRYRG